MVVGEMPEGVDLLIVGGGPGGYTAALEAAALGRSVTLVDAEGTAGLGGTCLLRGCIPSKGLIEIAEVRSQASDLARGALSVPTVDMAAFQTWKSSVVTGLSHGIAARLKTAGVEIATGRFTFTGPQRGVVEKDGDHPPQHYEFTDAIIATGSRAIEVPTLPFSHPLVHDAASILDLETVPESLVVVGGGYIGIELGTALAKLGSVVTVVEALDTILPGAPTHASRLVARRAKDLGIEILTGHTALGVTDDGIEIEASGGRRVVRADAILVAVGRRPNTEELGLAEARISQTLTGHIAIDADGRASKHIAAIGDVVAGPALAHKATAEAKVAAASVSGRPSRMVSTVIPQVMFSDPEIAIARIEPGLGDVPTEEQTVSLRLPLGFSGRAATMGHTSGYVEIEIETDTEAIVSAVAVGPHSSELIGEMVLAIEMGATAEDLALSIHPHPTLSEMWPDAAALRSN